MSRRNICIYKGLSLEFESMFMTHKGGYFLKLLLYVDNMLIVGYDRKKIEILKQALSKSFELKDTSLAKKVVAIHIVWDKTKRLFWL